MSWAGDCTRAALGYEGAGFAYMLACSRSILRNARILREHGKRPLIAFAFLKAFWLWPKYLLHRKATQYAEDPNAKERPLFIGWHKPDYDKIEKLERDIYGPG